MIDVLVSLAIGLLILVPFLLFCGLILALIRYLWRKGNR